MNKAQLCLPIEKIEAPIRDDRDIWRPIHYLGSKLRIVEPIRSAIDRVEPDGGPVCDLFAGSGTVSAALSFSRRVIAVDIQEYSRVLCSAILRRVTLTDFEVRRFTERALGPGHSKRLECASPLSDYETECLKKAALGNVAPICELIEHASIAAFEGSRLSAVSPALAQAVMRTRDLIKASYGDDFRQTLILNHFGGLYFSYRQAAQLDSLLAAAHNESERARDLLLASIISAASEAVNTVGKHFAQPIRPRGSDGKPKRHLIGKILRDRAFDIVSLFSEWLERYRSLPMPEHQHTVIRADFADALTQVKGHVGAVYADPPYTRDHYSRFYHVLETMCLWDDPGISTTRIRATTDRYSRGMYRAQRHQSPFCIKSQAPGAFERLFDSVKALRVPLVLSYSPYASNQQARPRVMTVDEISALAKRFFNRVEQLSAGRISHMKLNTSRFNSDPSYDAELIFLCT